MRDVWSISDVQTRRSNILWIWGAQLFGDGVDPHTNPVLFLHSYEPANRQTTPDFLVAVTDPNGRIPRGGFSNQPRTAAEFAEYFRKSDLGRANSAAYDTYLDEFVGKAEVKSSYVESARAEFAKRTRKSRLVHHPHSRHIDLLTSSDIAHTC